MSCKTSAQRLRLHSRNSTTAASSSPLSGPSTSPPRQLSSKPRQISRSNARPVGRSLPMPSDASGQTMSLGPRPGTRADLTHPCFPCPVLLVPISSVFLCRAEVRDVCLRRGAILTVLVKASSSVDDSRASLQSGPVRSRQSVPCCRLPLSPRSSPLTSRPVRCHRPRTGITDWMTTTHPHLETLRRTWSRFPQ